jgi:hypothetical protein
MNKPTKQIVPLAIALSQWREPALYQQKIDGKFAEREICGNVFAGELVGTQFFAFDLLSMSGQDARPWPTIDRWRALNSFGGEITRAGWRIVPSGEDGAALLESVLAAGGEGVVKKDWHTSYFAGMSACKKVETFHCVVTGIGPGQSVKIAFAPPFLDVKKMNYAISDLEPPGSMPLKCPRIDNVRVGSILKVEAYGRHASGLLREARPCKDTPDSWLIKF